jgi:hypothetical protein
VSYSQNSFLLTLFVSGPLPKSVNFDRKTPILRFGQIEILISQLVDNTYLTRSPDRPLSNGTAVVISGDCLGKVEDFK